MIIFVSGGSKSGKSLYAQKLAKAMETPDGLYYVATMKPFDNEDNARIAHHIEERSGWGFETVEQPHSIEAIVDFCDVKGSFLIDSMTALLTNEMFSSSHININAYKSIISGLDKIFGLCKNVVIVSDYVYSDAYVYDEYTDHFRKSLALIDRFCAEKAQIVLEFIYGNIIIHKGDKELCLLNEKLG